MAAVQALLSISFAQELFISGSQADMCLSESIFYSDHLTHLHFALINLLVETLGLGLGLSQAIPFSPLQTDTHHV